jgi:uncharacterized membrane protein
MDDREASYTFYESFMVCRRFGVIPQMFLMPLSFFLFGDFRSLFSAIFYWWI